MPSFKNNPDDLEKIPRTSGLYYFYDKNDKLLYVGKAKNLHSRIFGHRNSYLFHREGMFFRKILISKGLLTKNQEEWPEELHESWLDFELRGLSKISPIVIDYIFHKIKRIEIEDVSDELTKSKEKEMILKLKPPFNHQTASYDYYKLSQDLELED